MTRPLISCFSAALMGRGLAALLLCAAVGAAGASDGAHPSPDRGAKAAPASRAAAARGQGAALEVSLDELRDRLASRVAEVRDAQARTPLLKVSVKGDKPLKVAGDGHAPTAAAARSHAGAKGAKPDAVAHAAAPAVVHAVVHADAGHPHWSYQGDAGPAAWASLKPEFASCGNGQRQSPIDIRDGIKVELDAVQYDYRPSRFTVIDNGHTVQVNVAPGNSIEVTGRRYELLQFHFHRPSEERINGRQFDMVAHLVHKDPQGRLAVVAVLLQQGRQHPLVQLVWNSLPLEQNDETPAPVPLDLNMLLPEDRRYYTYMGSLTTPPCSEGVLWMVLKQPAQLSPEQVAVFARLYPMNARPIQQAGGRIIKESN
ncbi:Carbonate dehydratase [Leptothrix cholodnii SP-6]|uniref:carbonic anhydrase n=1 Tax=Leptothrix cholodnii (strain ATCC 51168 / LMG 8142 / SP-6) TaxID=395495 RepID=B1XY18_LEPCP|nr:carbonic anhydrase family protein [Leptothrix cholodnii]ACB32787.1 Carbonate dehydratase [Leptothrix cholodnii SP-6]